MGGAMLRDFTIVATAFEVQATEAKSWIYWCLLFISRDHFAIYCRLYVCVDFGYRDAVSITTIGAGAVTYIVGPVTGAAIGASSEVMALSIATGLVKAICVMVSTPLTAKFMGLDNPRSAMILVVWQER